MNTWRVGRPIRKGGIAGSQLASICGLIPVPNPADPSHSTGSGEQLGYTQGAALAVLLQWQEMSLQMIAGH